MIVKHLKINNLRNIQAAELDPHPCLNILHGDNGAGKTSVIEAMVVLSKGRSFRSGGIVSLIGPCADSFRVVAEVTGAGVDTGRNHRLGLERNADGWKARVDGRDVQQISELAPRLPLVLLEPNSHELISGAPDGRRKFLDWGVFHVKHGHLDAWRRYTRAIRQRNAALRSHQRRIAASLDPQLARLGRELEVGRRDHVEQLSARASELVAWLSPGMQEVSLAYEPGWRGEDLLGALEAGLVRDLERGATRAGPHRADLAIRLNGVAARERLSRGEQKILAAALLLAQAGIMQEAGATPLLLMDDLCSEFDRAHLGNVLNAGKRIGAQMWVTGTSPRAYLEADAGEATLFHVEQGRIGTG